MAKRSGWVNRAKTAPQRASSAATTSGSIRAIHPQTSRAGPYKGRGRPGFRPIPSVSAPAARSRGSKPAQTFNQAAAPTADDVQARERIAAPRGNRIPMLAAAHNNRVTGHCHTARAFPRCRRKRELDVMVGSTGTQAVAPPPGWQIHVPCTAAIATQSKTQEQGGQAQPRAIAGRPSKTAHQRGGDEHRKHGDPPLDMAHQGRDQGCPNCSPELPSSGGHGTPTVLPQETAPTDPAQSPFSVLRDKSR